MPDPHPQVCIEDPFELSHDLGRTVDRQTRAVLHKEFTRAEWLIWAFFGVFMIASLGYAWAVATPEIGEPLPLRIAAEHTWLHARARHADLVHHGGGTVPFTGHHPVLLTVHDLQYRMFPQPEPVRISEWTSWEAPDPAFWVGRGYAVVNADLRGWGHSAGEPSVLSAQEADDVHDLVEWAAAQPWCDGTVGMIGISYFAMTQLEAAVEKPPHLKAIFPVAATADLFEAASHHGLVSSSFLTPFLSMMGLTAGRSGEFWRSLPLKVARHVLNTPALHRRFGTMNGEAAVTVMRRLLELPHDPHPWDDLWRDAFVEHPLRDSWWDERDLTALLADIDIPVYLGCDWENVPLHLPFREYWKHGFVDERGVLELIARIGRLYADRMGPLATPLAALGASRSHLPTASLAKPPTMMRLLAVVAVNETPPV